MFQGFFQWLRVQVKQAVLGGVNDAIEELDKREGDDDGVAVAVLQNRMQRLPAPETKVKRK